MAKDMCCLLAEMPQEDNLLTPQQSTTEDDNAQILLEIEDRVYIFFMAVLT